MLEVRAELRDQDEEILSYINRRKETFSDESIRELKRLQRFEESIQRGKSIYGRGMGIPQASYSNFKPYKIDKDIDDANRTDEFCKTIIDDIKHVSSVISTILDLIETCKKIDSSRLSQNDAFSKAYTQSIIRDLRSVDEKYKSLFIDSDFNKIQKLSKKTSTNNKQIFDEETADELTYIKEQIKENNLSFLTDDLYSFIMGTIPPSKINNYCLKLSSSITNNPLHLHELIAFGEHARNDAVRVMILGPPGAGKTSLTDRLLQKPIELVKSITLGLNYFDHTPFNIHSIFSLPDDGLSNLELYLWDFGGQTIFHGMHSAFLHENCVYVLVVDSRHEQEPDEWLCQIRHISGKKKIEVLVITNIYEGCVVKQNETQLIREFGDLLNKESFFYFSLLDKRPEELDLFIMRLITVARSTRRNVYRRLIIAEECLKEEYLKNVVSIDYSSLKKVLSKKIPEELFDYPSLLAQLTDLGLIVPFTQEGLDYCLNPSWLVDKSYMILQIASRLSNNGKLAVNELLEDLEISDDNDLDSSRLSLLLKFIEYCGLGISLVEDSPRSIFFPDAAQINEPEILRADTDYKNTFTIEFQLPYIPTGLHSRLVSYFYNQNLTIRLHSYKDIWRKGFIIRKRKNHIDSSAVVEYLHRYSAIKVMANGKSSDVSNIMVNVYNSLLNNIAPIKEHEIFPLVILSRGFFDPSSSNNLSITKKWLSSSPDVEVVIQEAQKVEERNEELFLNNTSEEGDDADISNCIFLCHNTEDKPLVRIISNELQELDIQTWLDEEKLSPGKMWQDELEEEIGNIGCVAVFVGNNGIGPWQRNEITAFLSQSIKRQCPVIPVILPNAKSVPDLPIFLQQLTWIDLRVDFPKGIKKLSMAIK